MDAPPSIVDTPLIREDLSLTGRELTSIKGCQSSHRMDDDHFRECHKADIADLRSQLLELRQSQQKGNTFVSTGAATVVPAISPMSAFTTVLAYLSKSDAPIFLVGLAVRSLNSTLFVLIIVFSNLRQQRLGRSSYISPHNQPSKLYVEL